VIYDLLVVGGGINGCAIARDAAGRGLSVALVEKDDLAAGTSSASTKLIHGGLRYLENYEFRLVREALGERETLLASAPHLIRPLTFILPHGPGLRPAWMLRIGLFLYDHLAARKKLAGSRGVALGATLYGAPLRPQFTRGFSYSDCWADDSRLVALNALDAHERGARICNGAKLIAAARENGRWRADVETPRGPERIEARGLVNAAGPWASEVVENRLHAIAHKHVRLVKGSHLVTRRLYDGAHAYILQNADKRIVFVIPYEDDFTLIGTTDEAYSGAPGRVEIDAAETDYLLASVNRFLRTPVVREDVVWSYSGLRPLFDDGALNASVVTRDYAFDLDARPGEAPLLSVFGGKLTTARVLAEHALSELAPHLPAFGPAWTARAFLPGGDFADGDFDAFLRELTRRAPFLDAPVARRLARAYGTRAYDLLGAAQSRADLGADYGGGLTEAELDYLTRVEWARSAEDVLWRRSKLGLRLSPEQRAAVAGRVGG
jgi:glycerol-3-phosphate dehydrogenase